MSKSRRKNQRQSRVAAAAPVSRGPSRSLLFGLLIGVVVLTAWTYAPVREYPFVAYDDAQFVSANPYVLQGLTWEGVRWAFSLGCECSVWDPLTWLSHMVDVELFGVNPGAHHIVNLVLHLGNTGIVLLLLARLTGAVWPSAFAAALFGIIRYMWSPWRGSRNARTC
jgi:protein O-mannosyl-transferase